MARSGGKASGFFLAPSRFFLARVPVRILALPGTIAVGGKAGIGYR
jgi:hypothetical protein